MPAILLFIHDDGQILFFIANSNAKKRVNLVEGPKFIFEANSR